MYFITMLKVNFAIANVRSQYHICQKNKVDLYGNLNFPRLDKTTLTVVVALS